jgi:hypothetical protein
MKQFLACGALAVVFFQIVITKAQYNTKVKKLTGYGGRPF